MKKLSDSKVLRGGRTAREWTNARTDVRVGVRDGALAFAFELASKGGGTVDVEPRIGPKDFDVVAQTMASVDRTAALTAMAGVIASAVAKQEDHDRATTERAWTQLLEAIANKYEDAVGDSELVGKILGSNVSRIIDELRAQLGREITTDQDA